MHGAVALPSLLCTIHLLYMPVLECLRWSLSRLLKRARSPSQRFLVIVALALQPLPMASALIQCHSLCESTRCAAIATVHGSHISHFAQQYLLFVSKGHHRASYCTVSYGALQIRLMPEVFRVVLLGQRLSCAALRTAARAEHGDFQSFPTATCGLVKQLAPSFSPSSATASSALPEAQNFQPPSFGPFLKLLEVTSLGLWTAKECTDASTRIASPARGEGEAQRYAFVNTEPGAAAKECKRCQPANVVMSWEV